MTPAELARARELLDAWQKGAAREGDLAELRALLPKVLEAGRALLLGIDDVERAAHIANKEAAMPAAPHDQYLARLAAAGIGRSTWHCVVRRELAGRVPR